MANRLSDEELRESLKEYGEDVGPITPTTRTAWERRLNSIRKSKGFSSRKSSLNAFSSDDSEIENSFTAPRRTKRTSLNYKNANDSLNSSSLSGNFSLDESTFKKPTSPSISIQSRKMLLEKPNHLNNQHFVGKLKRNSTKVTPFEVETSDSEFDSDYPSHSKLSRRTRRKSNPKSSAETSTRNSQNFSSLQLNSLASSAESSQGVQLQPFNPRHFKPDHVGQSYTNGYISNTTNGDLNGKKVVEGSSTNYSHCISWLLLFGTAAFFIVIGVVYITELQKTTQLADKNSKFCGSVKAEDCENLILLSRELHQLLTTTAGIYDCALNTRNLKRNVTIPDARIAMNHYFSQSNGFKIDNFDDLFTESVMLLTRFPDMGIKSYPTYEDEVALLNPSNLEISALEAVHGSKTLKCRIQLSFKWTLTKVILLCFGGIFLFLCFLLTKFWKKRKEAQEKMFYDLVDQVIDTLKEETNEWSGENEIYKAVVKVRDAVIPPQERKEKLWLWDRVVAFIEDHESRVSVDYRTINGEDFKVWKWQPTTNIETESGKHGKVWQGQAVINGSFPAFTSVGKAKNTMYSLSPCLKIRNMFDSDVEYDEGWQTIIQDAILEKCEGNDGIRHIAIDNSNNEGCVYMLCSSSETAGKAFNDLHGWWFDGKLVTVKYITFKRYLERFPGSEHRTEPLRPSNNKRLSLSAPFFQSALERS